MANLKQNSSRDPEAGDDSDDFVMLDEPIHMPVRAKGKEPVMSSSPSITLNSCKSDTSFLITIEPPSKPVEDIGHVPCDIVLVIDVSGSMAELAPLPDVEDKQERESSGLTVLDLVRHASRTIISTLNEHDRLAIITFSQDSKVVQPLTNMNTEAKSDTLTKVDGLRDEGATNLWAGIKAGLQQFEQNPPNGNIQGLYVLTDGQPNYMCPQQGYIPKLQPVLRNLFATNGSAPCIQTFGFGYSIRSDLMLSIAKAGNGNFAFIPEVGMIGTVFVHAVANLYATYASNAVLEVSLDNPGAVDFDHVSGLPVKATAFNKLTIKLGNLQYGQSRDLVISYSAARFPAKKPIIAKLTYTPHAQSAQTMSTTLCLNQPSTMSQSTIKYHLLRNDLCSFLSSLYPIDPVKKQHSTIAVAGVEYALSNFQSLVDKLTSIPSYKSDSNISSLLSDLIGASMDPQQSGQGQIHQALQTTPQTKNGQIFKSYWHKWGRHYLSSLWSAHMRQTCNSFKDPGPLRYGANSELFKKCRDELDAAFDNLPPPVGTYTGSLYDTFTHNITPAAPQAIPHGRFPTRGAQAPGTLISPNLRSTGAARTYREIANFSMARYNSRDSVCFLGTCMIKLANGSSVAVEDLRPGDLLRNPLSGEARTVVGIVRGTYGPQQLICRVNNELWITPWHPVLPQGSHGWVFPQTLAAESRFLQENEAVYSILLKKSDDFRDHTIEVEGMTCTTLGHGITVSTKDDCRAHPFFGDYALVKTSLETLPIDQQGRRLCSGLIRSSRTGLACGMFAEDAFVQPAARL